MKLLVISDIHGNWTALQAVLAAESDSDQVLCLGDLVDYGPQPKECVQWAMSQKSLWLVQGNHDFAVGLDKDPQCSEEYGRLAFATKKMSRDALKYDEKHFLATRDRVHRFPLGKAVCYACHATPSDPLFNYLAADGQSTKWQAELIAAEHPGFLFLGHTHLPVSTKYDSTWVVNPGSVGMPKDGDPRAAYAVWKDGSVELRRARYNIEETVAAYFETSLDLDDIDRLARHLRTGKPIRRYSNLLEEPV